MCLVLFILGMGIRSWKSMNSKTYKSIERRVGPQIEKVARTSCSHLLDEEVQGTEGNNDLAISYEMG